MKRIGRPRKNRPQSISPTTPKHPQSSARDGEPRRSPYSHQSGISTSRFSQAAGQDFHPSPLTANVGRDFRSAPSFDEESFSTSARSSARLGSISDTSGYEESNCNGFVYDMGGFIPSPIVGTYTTALSDSVYNSTLVNNSAPGSNFPVQGEVWAGAPGPGGAIFDGNAYPKKPSEQFPNFMTSIEGEALSLDDINNMIEASMEGVLHYGSPDTSASTSENYNSLSRNDSLNDSLSASTTGSPIVDTSTIATIKGRSSSTSIPLPPTSATTAPTAICTSKCYAALTQQLLFLNNLVPAGTTPSIDTILLLEGNARFYKEKILACAYCLANRSSLLLLSIIAEQLVTILERKFEKATTASGADEHQDESDKATPLIMGGIEIEEEVKVRYVWKLLRLRLNKFADMVRDLQEKMRVDPGVGESYKAGRGIVRDAHARLVSLVAAVGGA